MSSCSVIMHILCLVIFFVCSCYSVTNIVFAELWDWGVVGQRIINNIIECVGFVSYRDPLDNLLCWGFSFFFEIIALSYFVRILSIYFWSAGFRQKRGDGFFTGLGILAIFLILFHFLGHANWRHQNILRIPECSLLGKQKNRFAQPPRVNFEYRKSRQIRNTGG